MGKGAGSVLHFRQDTTAAQADRVMTILREHRNITEKGWPVKWVLKDKSAIHYVPIATNYDRWGKRL